MADQPFTEAEGQTLVNLIYRFCDAELDQFDHWRVDSRWGPVFVSFRRALPPGEPDELYRPMPRREDAARG